MFVFVLYTVYNNSCDIHNTNPTIHMQCCNIITRIDSLSLIAHCFIYLFVTGTVFVELWDKEVDITHLQYYKEQSKVPCIHQQNLSRKLRKRHENKKGLSGLDGPSIRQTSCSNM